MLHRVLRPRRNRSSAMPPVTRSGFTLAELLIVIAIIGVLISILLPTLGAARRSANSAKCLAALRDMGLAFQQYAMENKRAFPVVEYSPPASQLLPGTPARRSWQDFLVKYLHKKDPDGNLIQYQNGSVLWGCPSYDADTFWKDVDPGTAVFNLPTVPNKFNTGYGMQRYALAPHAPVPDMPAVKNGTATDPGNTAMIRDPSLYGSFFKMEVWGKRGSDRALLADAITYDIVGASTWNNSDPAGTGSNEKRCDPFISGTTGRSWVSVDGTRHVAPTSNMKKIMNTKGVNMLFVDGHAASVTPEEAWIAIRGGGLDVRAQ